MKHYNQLQSIANSIRLVGCLCFIIVLASCAPSSTDTTSRPTDNAAILASLIKTSNPDFAGLNVDADNSDPASPKLAITGLTNSASGDPVTATINIDQDKGITTDPTSFTVTAPALISPHDQETTLMVTFGSEAPVSYAVTTQIGGAPVSSWLTSETISTYVKATFVNQPGTIVLAERTISVIGLTNSPTGTGEITFELPAGFASTPATIEIPNPDGTGTITSTPNPNSFTITETGNSGNSQEYTIADISLAELTRFTPGTHIRIADSTGADITSTLRFAGEDNNVIRITGLTNREGANTYTLTIDEVAEFFTTPGNAPIERTITEPVIDFSSGTGIITSRGTSAPTFEITNVGESATMYTLEVIFTEVAVNEWFPAKLSTYITASFAGQTADTLALNEGTIAISHSASANNFTNVPNGMIVFTTALPSGYELVATGLKDPDEEMLAAVTNGDAGMITISETGNADNSQVYPVRITLAAYKSPLTPGGITATYGGITALLSDKKIEANMITISGFTNKDTGTAESGTVTFAAPNGYTVTPTSLNITDPTGAGATDENIGMVTVTNTSTGVEVSHSVVVEFFATTQLRIAGGEIMNSPTTISSGGTVAITTGACQLLAAPTITIIDADSNDITGSKVADATPFPLYYDRERDTLSSGKFSVTRKLTLEDGSGGVLSTGFTITMEFPACTSFAAGTGADAANAYEIESAPRLDLASHLVNTDNANYGDKFYKITANIDMGLPGLPLSEKGSMTPDRSGATGKGFLPIGKQGTNFFGTFDCDSKMISNIYINRPSTGNVGLLGVLGGASGSATVRNCFLIDVKITGNNGVGGLAGQNTSSSIISNSYVTGALTGNEYVGALVGENNSSMIRDSYATGAVIGSEYVGGLAGGNVFSSTITNSYATGAVLGTSIHVGGLVGWNFSNSSISKSYATGTVTGNEYVGGLVGGNNLDAAISDSYATGAVSGTSNNVGGLVGYNYITSTIMNSYATGTVSGSTNIGGLVGYNQTTSAISNSYATGAVSGNDAVGGLVGKNSSSTVTASYWDTQTTGQTTSAGGAGATGRTTAQMQVAAPVTGADEVYTGWDATTIWQFATGKYPQLRSVVCANRQDNPAAVCM